MKEKLELLIDAELVKHLKHQAALSGMSLSELIEVAYRGRSTAGRLVR